MSVTVHLTKDAARDLEQIYDFVGRHDSPARAEQVLAEMERAFESLSDQPNRGRHPTELLEIGVREYREVFFKPYRIVYRVKENQVFVLLIADGRRDMRTLLERRLLQA